MYYVEFVSQIYYTKKLNPTLVEYFPINTKKYYENFICNFIEKKEEGERERKRRRTCSIGWSDFEVETIVCDFADTFL